MNPDPAKLQWLCRRGMKELDVLFEDYLSRSYPQSSAAAKEAFVELLQLQDPHICDLLFGHEHHPNCHVQHLIDQLRQHSVLTR